MTSQDSTCESQAQRPTFAVSCMLWAALAALPGCMVIGDLAYQSAVDRERARCETFVNMPDRQDCLQRVNTAAKQADEQKRTH